MATTETATASNTFEFPFSNEGFAASFDRIKPLIREEWPAIDEEALDATEADPAKIVALVADRTEHSKALVRKHLGEIAEVAGVGAANFEQRLVRLIHLLEEKAEPVQQGVANARKQATKLVHDVEERGGQLIDEVKQTVPKAEEKMKDNLWTSLLAALGVGVLLGLIVGLTRGR